MKMTSLEVGLGTTAVTASAILDNEADIGLKKANNNNNNNNDDSDRVEGVDLRKEVKSSTVSSQTLSPAGSTVSTVSSQESIDDKKRRFSNIQEEETDESFHALTQEKKRSEYIEQQQQQPIPKLHRTETVADRNPGENDLNILDEGANEVLEDLKKSIRDAQLALGQEQDAGNKRLISQLIDSLSKAKSLILKLNLNKNLFKFQINSELEQNNIEKQILLRNLETFQKNLNTLIIDNNNLNTKNQKLIKYYKNLKYGKFKDLKLKNSNLAKELDSFKHNKHSNPQSSSSSGRSSIAHAPQSENNMLNTLGMLASQVLANEEPQQIQISRNGSRNGSNSSSNSSNTGSKPLPPTFGSTTSFKSPSTGSPSANEDGD